MTWGTMLRVTVMAAGHADSQNVLGDFKRRTIMPKFYFHIRDGDKWIEDSEGLDLPNVDAAKKEAIKAAREMLAARLMAGEVLDGQTLEIWDGHNLIAAIPFKEVVELP